MDMFNSFSEPFGRLDQPYIITTSQIPSILALYVTLCSYITATWQLPKRFEVKRRALLSTRS